MKTSTVTKNIYILLFIFSPIFIFSSKTVSAQDSFNDDFNATIYENEVGISDPTGMYRLDSITADAFQQITDIERENALIELQIKQEKLKLDLEKQYAEQIKLEQQLLDNEIARNLKQAEQERKVEEEKRKIASERLKEEQESLRVAEERQKQRQQQELNDQLLAKIGSADLSNPEEMDAVAQLMSFVTGKQVTDLGASRLQSKVEDKPQLSFSQQYVVKSIMGVGGNLIANITNTQTQANMRAKKGFVLDGWYVKDIKGTSVLLEKDGQSEIIYLN